MDFLLIDVLGKPLWLWGAFLGLVLGLLAFDLGVFHRGASEIGVRESLTLSAVYIVIGLAFGGFVAWQAGADAGMQYLTGFVIEKCLAVDNVFVIALIFSAFAIRRELQHRTLFWGVLGVIVLRGIVIGFGAALVARFEWLLYLFPAFLVLTGARMLLTGKGGHDGPPKWLSWLNARIRVTDGLRGDRFLVREQRGLARGHRGDPGYGRGLVVVADAQARPGDGAGDGLSSSRAETSRRCSAGSSFSSHSQTTSARQPSASIFAAVSWSRVRLRAILARQ